jgi:hypothetical protein
MADPPAIPQPPYVPSPSLQPRQPLDIDPDEFGQGIAPTSPGPWPSGPIPRPGEPLAQAGDGGLEYPWDQINAALRKYPVLNKYLDSFRFNYVPRGPGSHLETFPPGESGTAQYPRPKAFPIDKYGIDIYDTKITPDAIMGDATIHGLRRIDPKINYLYQLFFNSITQDPHQYAELMKDYKWAQLNENEKRPLMQWAADSRINELFGTPFYKTEMPRGWSRQRFTDQQRRIMNEMYKYVSGQ